MKIYRLASLALVAIMAMSLLAASAAVAAPEFKPSSKVSFTTTGDGSSVLAASGVEVKCAKSSSTGEITSATLAGNVIVHFLECEGKEGTNANCPIMSTGAPLENLIQTTTLHGVLGLILPKPALGSDVALVLLPVSGKRFVTLLPSSANCLEEIQVNGSVAGTVEPVGTATLKGKLTFSANGVNEAITDVDLSTGTLVLPRLTAGTATATETTLQLVTFAAAVEVT